MNEINITVPTRADHAREVENLLSTQMAHEGSDKVRALAEKYRARIMIEHMAALAPVQRGIRVLHVHAKCSAEAKRRGVCAEAIAALALMWLPIEGIPTESEWAAALREMTGEFQITVNGNEAGVTILIEGERGWSASLATITEYGLEGPCAKHEDIRTIVLVAIRASVRGSNIHCYDGRELLVKGSWLTMGVAIAALAEAKC
jgi:hypothetical protein